MADVTSTREIQLHGHCVSYREAGAASGGPVVVLLHGIAGSGQTWDDVLGLLGERHTVIAPDMLGHGGSAKPRSDYSLGAYASGVRDLLTALGHDRATIVGHSLGGGVAMQFAYQFPDRVERLALVASGGLGAEVSLILRAVALPGAEWIVPLVAKARLDDAGAAVAGVLNRIGMHGGADFEEIARGYASLKDAATRRAFVHTVRSVIDAGGQRIDASDRLYLAEEVPSMLVWGDRDRIIPVSHAIAAHAKMPGSRLEVIPSAGHFPHRHDPRRFVELLERFITETEPAQVDVARMRERLLAHAARA
jgi:pimeloyl-ACP methyl ester carboxylesterase